MYTVTVTRLNNGEVVVESDGAPDIRLRNQESAHTWLATKGYKIVGKTLRQDDDYISGTYVRVGRGLA